MIVLEAIQGLCNLSVFPGSLRILQSRNTLDTMMSLSQKYKDDNHITALAFGYIRNMLQFEPHASLALLLGSHLKKFQALLALGLPGESNAFSSILADVTFFTETETHAGLPVRSSEVPMLKAIIGSLRCVMLFELVTWFGMLLAVATMIFDTAALARPAIFRIGAHGRAW